MLFNSYTFIFLFVPFTLLLTALARRFGGVRAASAILVAASLFFYAYHDIRLLALIGGSIVLNYLLTGFIFSAEGRKRYWFTVLGVVLNLALLAYFKYTNFFLENVAAISGADFDFKKIALPIGISFYTFQQVAYNTDTYSRKIKERDFLSYALFVAFFPQLIAGPIVHHGQIIKQFASEAFGRIRWENILIGVSIFGLGLFSKKILADTFAGYATPVFVSADQGEAVSFLMAWKGSLSYTFQIYFDFAGYSTMAVGLGRMFGVKLPTNFFSPYKSTNIIEFWRRWHITLSTFLRDYLYIAMGGNRKGKARRWFNLLATMVLGGLWHGASWNFVIWGTLHGVYLVINHAWNMVTKRVAALGRMQKTTAWKLVGWLITFVAVVAAWVGFRAVTLGGNLSLLSSMFGFKGLGDLGADLATLDLKFWLFLIAGFAIALGMPNMAQIFGNVRATYEEHGPAKAFGLITVNYKPNVMWSVIMAVIAAIAVFYLSPTTEFLYWAF